MKTILPFIQHAVIGALSMLAYAAMFLVLMVAAAFCFCFIWRWQGQWQFGETFCITWEFFLCCVQAIVAIFWFPWQDDIQECSSGLLDFWLDNFEQRLPFYQGM